MRTPGGKDAYDEVVFSAILTARARAKQTFEGNISVFVESPQGGGDPVVKITRQCRGGPPCLTD